MDGPVEFQDESVLCGTCTHCGESCSANAESMVLDCPDYDRKLSDIFKNLNLCETCAKKLMCMYKQPATTKCLYYITDAGDSKVECTDACPIDFGEVKIEDKVNHPSHYTRGGIECIDAIRASMISDEFEGYCKGNVLKYLWRWRDKGGTEDLHKALVYLTWLIESAEKSKEIMNGQN